MKALQSILLFFIPILSLAAAPIDQFRIASQKGDASTMRKLIEEKKVTPDLKDKDGNTPLHYSIGDPQSLKMLLSMKANPDIQNNEKETALHHASYFGLIESMKLLIEAKAGLNIMAKDGVPLHYAVYKGQQYQAAELLLKKNADPDATDHNGYTALHWAAYKGYEKMAELLLKFKAKPDIQIKETGFTPLHLAASIGNGPICKILLNHRAKVDPVDNDNYTPLFRAVVNKQMEVAQILIDYKANPDHTDRKKNTLLHYAAFSGDIETMKILLSSKRKINIDQPGEKNLSAMFIALLKENDEIVKMLITKGADVNQLNSAGDTALIWLCSKGKKDMIVFFLQNKADVNKKNKNGITPLKVARHFKFNDIAEILEKKGAIE